jgi:hypothetical protein
LQDALYVHSSPQLLGDLANDLLTGGARLGLFEETHILYGDRCLVGQSTERAYLCLSPGMGLAAGYHEQTGSLPAGNQR